jgi:hypothetical protein
MDELRDALDDVCVVGGELAGGGLCGTLAKPAVARGSTSICGVQVLAEAVCGFAADFIVPGLLGGGRTSWVAYFDFRSRKILSTALFPVEAMAAATSKNSALTAASNAG